MKPPDKERTISFRVTEEAWIEIEKRASETRESPHQWARSAALEKLCRPEQLTPGERLLFQHFVRAQYLFTQGFQLLADKNLIGEQWIKIRANAKEKASELAGNALAKYANRNRER